jgi:hypothetical protein
MRSELPSLLVFMSAVVLIMAGLFLACGCGGPPPAPAEAAPLPKAAPIHIDARPGTAPDRFTVESRGGFHAGYDENVREIMIVTDTQTGIQYLAVTGCGTTELRRVQRGKVTVTEEE